MPVAPEEPTTTRTILLTAIVDFSIITAIIIVGQISHEINPLADISHSLLTYTPFYVGWILTAPLLGAYHSATVTAFRNTTLIIGVAWILTVLTGGTLRATTFFPGESPPLFLLVMTGVGLLGLIPWRIALTYYSYQTAPE